MAQKYKCVFFKCWILRLEVAKNWIIHCETISVKTIKYKTEDAALLALVSKDKAEHDAVLLALLLEDKAEHDAVLLALVLKAIER